MHIFKENLQNFSNFSQKCDIMIFISCVFKIVYIVNILVSSYKKILKLHRSCLGVKGGGAKQLSVQHLAVTVIIRILVISTTNSKNALRKCT